LLQFFVTQPTPKGDALGAPFESWTAQAIRKDCGQIRDMKAGMHLGVGVSGGARSFSGYQN